MTLRRYLIVVTIVALAVLAIPAWADSDPPSQEQEPRQDDTTEPARMEADTQTTTYGSSYSSDIGYQGWGLRAGVASDIDQVVGGAHFNLGEFVPHLRFQPDVQLGAGDDFTTLYGTAPVYYRFGTETRFTPYAGGGVSVGYVDHDGPGSGNSDDSDFEVGGKLTGGLEWPRPQGQAFFLELSLGFGDVHDATLLAAWSF
jgi:opacity protein-like surface antigen